VCVRACVRACVCACVRVCDRVSGTPSGFYTDFNAPRLLALCRYHVTTDKDVAAHLKLPSAPSVVVRTDFADDSAYDGVWKAKEINQFCVGRSLPLVIPFSDQVRHQLPHLICSCQELLCPAHPPNQHPSPPSTDVRFHARTLHLYFTLCRDEFSAFAVSTKAPLLWFVVLHRACVAMDPRDAGEYFLGCLSTLPILLYRCQLLSSTYVFNNRTRRSLTPTTTHTHTHTHIHTHTHHVNCTTTTNTTRHLCARRSRAQIACLYQNAPKIFDGPIRIHMLVFAKKSSESYEQVLKEMAESAAVRLLTLSLPPSLYISCS
jgi:hypothetical protein